MFARISNSWELVKASYSVLRSDRELMLFPLMSTIGVIIVTIVFALPLWASGILDQVSDSETLSSGQKAIGAVLAFLFYFVMYTIIIYANTALIGMALMRLRGEDPTVNDGFRIASEHIGSILGYAAISATVGVILNALRDRNNLLGRIIASFMSVAWNLITFLVIPVLVVENVGPIEAIKRSGSLLKQTWGEQIVGNFAIGMIFGLITLLVILLVGAPVVWIAASTGSTLLIVVGILLVVLIVMGINLVGAALNGIFQAALYMYAAQGKVSDLFEERLITGAFKPKHA
jgi:hypothetical protein